MSAELRLRSLLAAWPDDPERFQELGDATDNWAPILKRAQRHGVTGLLCQPWRKGTLPWPATIQNYWDKSAAGERLWSDVLCATLNDVLAKMASAQLKIIALKGPILAERLYADPTSRFSLDLDLLIAPTDLPEATRVLESLGYKPETGASARYYLRNHHHLLFQRAGKPPLELHFRLFSGFGVALESPEVLARAVVYQTHEGIECNTLAPEDEILYLAIHAAGHGFQRLCWLYDLKSFLRMHRQLDWDAIFQRAASAKLGNALSFALEILRRRLGMPDGFSMPSAACQYRDRWPAASRFLAWVEESTEGSRRSKAGWLLFQALLCDKPRLAIWYLQHHFLRIGRRRLHRLLPRVLPEDWAG